MSAAGGLAVLGAGPDATLLLGGLAAVALAVVLVGVAAVTGRPRREDGVARSLAAVQAIRPAEPPAADVRQRELARPFAERVLSPVLEFVTRVACRITPSDQAARIRRRLDLAGNPAGWNVDRIVGLALLLGVLGLALGLIAGQALALGAARTLGVAGLLAALGWAAPSLVVYQKAYERTERIARELPDAVDLMTITVESGLSFDAALAQVARHAEGPLAAEFARVLQEMQIGTGRTDALRALGDRTDVPDLRSFVAAMVQADAFGVPIARVLRLQAEEIRTKRSQRAEEAAQRVPVKILFPLILGILPSLFVVVIGPAVISAVGTLL